MAAPGSASLAPPFRTGLRPPPNRVPLMQGAVEDRNRRAACSPTVNAQDPIRELGWRLASIEHQRRDQGVRPDLPRRGPARGPGAGCAEPPTAFCSPRAGSKRPPLGCDPLLTAALSTTPHHGSLWPPQGRAVVGQIWLEYWVYGLFEGVDDGSILVAASTEYAAT